MSGIWPLSLYPEEVQQLKPYAAGIGNPDVVEYGTSLEEIVTGGWDREWLEAALLAGHLPHSEGLDLGYRAHFLWVRREVRGFLASGAPGDALGAVQAEARAARSTAMFLLAEAERLDELELQIVEVLAPETQSEVITPFPANQLAPTRLPSEADPSPETGRSVRRTTPPVTARERSSEAGPEAGDIVYDLVRQLLEHMFPRDWFA